MAWVTPPVFVSGNVLTAAQMNILSGDLNETLAAKATAAGHYLASTAANATVERFPNVIIVNVTETTSSTTFTDLATIGPDAFSDTGPWALVCMQAMVQPSAVGFSGQVGLFVGGASAIAAGNIYLSLTAAAINQQVTACGVRIVNGLTAGSNEFVMKYAVTGGSVGFGRRYLSIVPF